MFAKLKQFFKGVCKAQKRTPAFYYLFDGISLSWHMYPFPQVTPKRKKTKKPCTTSKS